MSFFDFSSPRFRTALSKIGLGTIPFVVLLLAWQLAPRLADYPAYMLPSQGQVLAKLSELLADGSLLHHISGSLGRLAAGFVLGNALAISLGIAISLSQRVSDYLRPTLVFMQAVAGIAWVPLAIIWFGIGIGPVLFVIANTIFFSALNNTVVGVQQIPPVLFRAMESQGASRIQLLTYLILPGAFVQLILGFRTSMAYGWRALVAGEMLAGTSGLGYMTLEAVRWYDTQTVVLGMLLIGVIWLVIDRLVFVPIERRTVHRWGVMQR